jgi:hypothetical protein
VPRINRNKENEAQALARARKTTIAPLYTQMGLEDTPQPVNAVRLKGKSFLLGTA